MKNVGMKVHILILTLLGAMIYPLLQGNHPIDASRYQQVQLVLNRIVQLDAASEENMMQLQNAEISHFDQLTGDAFELKQSYDRLVQTLPNKPTLASHLQQLQASIQLQMDMIDQFRRDFGIFQNSKRYLSTLIAQDIAESPSFERPLLQLRGDVFEFLVYPDENLMHRIVEQQHALKEAGFAQLSQHIDILLRYGKAIQKLIHVVTHCGTPEHAYQLSGAYNVLYAKQVQDLKEKRIWLLWLTALFAAYLVVVLYLLLRSRGKLAVSHQKLEASKRALEKEFSAHKQVEQRYRALIDASSAAIMTLADKHFVSANAATLRMFGIQDEETFLTMGPVDISPEFQADGCDSRTAAQNYIETAMEDGCCSFEWLHKRQSGEVFSTHVQLTAIEVEHERMLQAVVTDLSELKQLEKEKELLAIALANTADAIFITDTEARILYVNTAFETLTGYRADEAVGQFASLLRSPHEKPEVYARIPEKLNQGKVWKGELLTRFRSGKEVLVERTISPVMDRLDQVISHVVMMRDMTDEKEQAKKWEHTQRLESLGVLAGGIAHDFNNILTAIMGNAALAERSLDMTSPAKRNLATIEKSAQRAADLCRQMLAYSGKGKFVVQQVDLSTLVDEMVHLIEVSIEKNVVIKYHMADYLPAVEADIAQLQQIILNLITNANEAIGKRSGVISFTTGVMHADAQYLHESFCDDGVPEGRFAYFEVSDTGCGMDAETIEKMFDPFFTTKFTGRGLGMSAVLGIIRGHRGAIRVYSELGKGTTFKVLLPVVEHELLDEPGVAVASSEGAQAGGTILVVDDEDTIREVAAMMLEEMGFSTLAASNGMEGVEVYQQHQSEIVAVLLDMTMPKMDGKACFRELRRINKDVKVILSSGYSEENVTARFQGKGLSGFVQKPYSPEHLKKTLMKVLKG